MFLWNTLDFISQTMAINTVAIVGMVLKRQTLKYSEGHQCQKALAVARKKITTTY